MTLVFEENMRYCYDLDRNSVVVDAGAYEGNFSRLIHQKYGCRIHAFEPVPRFYDQCMERFRDIRWPEIKLYCYGLGDSNRRDTMEVHGDSSKLSSSGAEHISIIDIPALLNLVGVETVDLLKLNIEGAEYELLESMLRLSLQHRFRNIQVQFHQTVPSYETRYRDIASQLSATHCLTYCEPYCWENWQIKG